MSWTYFISAPGQDDIVAVDARSSHSSIVFFLLTSFYCLIACLSGNSNYVFGVLVFLWYMASGTSKFALSFKLDSFLPHVCLSCL